MICLMGFLSAGSFLCLRRVTFCQQLGKVGRRGQQAKTASKNRLLSLDLHNVPVLHGPPDQTRHVQRLLQALLDLPTPTYRHHRLLTGPDGKRFAKRDKAETLRDLRARGVSAAELRAAPEHARRCG